MIRPSGILEDIARASDLHAAATRRMAETVLANRASGWTWVRMPIAALAACCAVVGYLVLLLALRQL